MEENEILDSQFADVKPRRRRLLPWWIKVFIWFFLLAGAFVPIGIIVGFLHYNVHLSLFGLDTNEPFSVVGLILLLIFSFKGVSAFGLWFEKDWAISVAQIDAVLSIAICVYMMLVQPFIHEVTSKFRLELALLVPYLLKLNDLKKNW